MSAYIWMYCKYTDGSARAGGAGGGGSMLHLDDVGGTIWYKIEGSDL